MGVIRNEDHNLLNKPLFVKPDPDPKKEYPIPGRPCGGSNSWSEKLFEVINLKNKPFKQISLTKALVQDHIFNLSYID